MWFFLILAAAALATEGYERSDGVILSPQMAEWYSQPHVVKRDSSSSAARFDYDSNKVYGVCIGHWLLTEPYIGPTLYKDAISSNETEDDIPVDEWHYCDKLGTEECGKRLAEHWETWINETDFQQIADWGFNSVRITIGYWAFAKRKSDPFCFGQQEYLDKAIEWCRNAGLHIWISFHGLPGSQNGFDNSGLRDELTFLNNTANYNLGMEALYYVMDKYGSDEYADVISGITNANEPLGPKLNKRKLMKFNQESYSQLRSISEDTPFVFHDAFLGTTYWDGLFGEGSDISSGSTLNRTTNYTMPGGTRNLTGGTNETSWSGKVKNVVIDHHHYDVFGTGLLAQPVNTHINSLKSFVSGIVDNETVQYRVVGEWSAALSDCAYWLNGVGRGSRFEGEYDTETVFGKCTYSNNVTAMSAKNKTDTRKFVEAQLDLYNETNGFFFWNYKTENAVEWDLSALMENDLFPNPITSRKYPDVLNTSAASASAMSRSFLFYLGLLLLPVIL